MPRAPTAESKVGPFLGIDPGANGGIAIVFHNCAPIVTPMPTTEFDIFSHLSGHITGTVAVIEWIHPAIFQIGKLQMSKLYGSYMALRMALTAAHIPFEDVRAEVWQQGIGIRKKKGEKQAKWKDRLRGKAQQLFPQLPIWNETLEKQRAIADALLIAHYCKLKHTGTL